MNLQMVWWLSSFTGEQVQFALSFSPTYAASPRETPIRSGSDFARKMQKSQANGSVWMLAICAMGQGLRHFAIFRTENHCCWFSAFDLNSGACKVGPPCRAVTE